MDADKIGWAAINSQFFTTVVAHAEWRGRQRRLGAAVSRSRSDARDVLAIEGALRMPAFSLAPGQSVTQSFEIYAGPKIYGVLKGLGDGQEQILNFGMFSPVSRLPAELDELAAQLDGQLRHRDHHPDPLHPRRPLADPEQGDGLDAPDAGAPAADERAEGEVQG